MAPERSKEDPSTKNKCVNQLVNELTPYEQLVAAKLDQVPVPDMADGIWSAIEMQLDALAGMADVPGQVPAGPVSPLKPASADTIRKPASAVRGWGWYALAGVVAVVIVLWWYFGHKRSGDTMPSKLLPEKHAPAPVTKPPVTASPVSDRPAKKKSVPLLPAGTKKDTVSFYTAPKDSFRTAPAAAPLPPPVRTDPPAVQTNRPALPYVDLYQGPSPAPHGKKPRGVKGITDDDYKLTTAKDSARKKH
jgi:hypothetical protein